MSVCSTVAQYLFRTVLPNVQYIVSNPIHPATQASTTEYKRLTELPPGMIDKFEHPILVKEAKLA